MEGDDEIERGRRKKMSGRKWGELSGRSERGGDWRKKGARGDRGGRNMVSEVK